MVVDRIENTKPLTRERAIVIEQRTLSVGEMERAME